MKNRTIDWKPVKYLFRQIIKYIYKCYILYEIIYIYEYLQYPWHWKWFYLIRFIDFLQRRERERAQFFTYLNVTNLSEMSCEELVTSVEETSSLATICPPRNSSTSRSRNWTYFSIQDKKNKKSFYSKTRGSSRFKSQKHTGHRISLEIF